jgi:beta-lactamase superfamily II metal-dependent hydrolase
MATIHFLNVLEGDCNIIQHNSGRVTVMDVSNAYNATDTPEEIKAKNSSERQDRMINENRNYVPTNKINYHQKKYPDNPIDYLKKLGVKDIFRFIISHPDMDHLDGIKDLYEEFNIMNTWDTDNNKTIELGSSFGGYNKQDWEFYTKLRDGKYPKTKRLVYYSKLSNSFYKEDYITILCPTIDLVTNANSLKKDYNNVSYAILFTPPKMDGGKWKILFAGDTHDASWDYILKNHKSEVSDIDILFAPHHGRDSGMNFEFLNVLNPTVTLFGNASSEHLAYDKYPNVKITNNQAGYVIMETSLQSIKIYVKNEEFANDFTFKRRFKTRFDEVKGAYFLGQINYK